MNRLLFRVTVAMIPLLSFGPLAAQSNQPVKFDEPGIPDAVWPQIYFRTFDRAVESAGFEPLRSKGRAPGTREVRIWINEALFRVVDKDGTVDGEMFRFWSTEPDPTEDPGETFHDLMIYYRAGSCENFNDVVNKGTCRTVFAQQPDWAEALRRAEAAQLWELPDSSELPPPRTMTLGGWGLTVELHDGITYRTYNHNNPQHRDEWPEAKHAVEIAAAFRDIEAFIQRADAVQKYRGIIRDDTDVVFRLCGSNEIWAIPVGIQWLMEQSGLTGPAPGAYGYLVEVLGMPTPEWVIRGWKSEFSGVLQALELVSIAPASDPTCE